jgi:hypothetical protein
LFGDSVLFSGGNDLVHVLGYQLMQKWEYLTLMVSSDKPSMVVHFPGKSAPELIEEPDRFNEAFNSFGGQGWELCGTIGSNSFLVVFKRPQS